MVAIGCQLQYRASARGHERRPARPGRRRVLTFLPFVASGAAFVLLPARAPDAAALLEVYPAARKEILRTEAGQAEVYLIDAETVRRAYEAAAGQESGAVAEAASGGYQKVGLGMPSG
jgi:hypothetical protein